MRLYSTFVGITVILKYKQNGVERLSNFFREATQKSSFLSGPATKALTPPSRLSGHRKSFFLLIFFRLKIAGNVLTKKNFSTIFGLKYI